MTRQILVATTNPGKLREFSLLLSETAWDIQWLSLRDFPGIPEVTEDGKTFAQNARKKARGYAEATGLWTLADDSGLVVDALNGLPGVHSARFAAQDSPFKDRPSIDVANYEKLLGLLKNTPQRTARFMCHLALAQPGKILIESEGSIEGCIIDTPAGSNGFGYDPVFYIPALGRTAAQLEDDQKNAVSHRGNAIRRLKPLLHKLLLDSPPSA